MHGPAGRRVLIGVGNRDRGDDAVGPVVCDLVWGEQTAEDRITDVTIAVLEGSVVDLPTRWQPADRVTIVDAAEPAGEPGRVTMVDALSERLTSPGTISTHTVDVGAAIELARALGRLPVELVIVGIEGLSFEFGAPLSPAVREAAERVATGFNRRVRMPADDS